MSKIGHGQPLPVARQDPAPNTSIADPAFKLARLQHTVGVDITEGKIARWSQLPCRAARF